MSNQKSFASVNTTGGLSYKVGDRVSHIKFGAGEVMAIVEGGRIMRSLWTLTRPVPKRCLLHLPN